MRSFQKNRRKVKTFQRLLKVANWIATLPNRMTPPPFRLLQIGSAFWQSRALYAAARLEIADILGDGTKSTQEMAETARLNEDHLYRLMRMLASLGIFTETAPRRFRNSKISEYLRRTHPKSLRDMVLMHNSPEMTRPWTEQLEAGVRSGGIPFEAIYGELLYTYMDSHPEFNRLFARAMDSVEALTGDDFFDDFDWGRFDRLIDMGGSKGSKALSILKRQPQLTAVVFDRETVVAEGPEYWRQHGGEAMLSRVAFVGGDIFESIPAPQSDRDLYMFVGVFHGMSDAEVGRALANLRGSFGERRPTLLVVETVAEACGIDPTVASFDMQMLVGTAGRERTLEEWQGVLGGAGFGIEEVVTVRTFARFIVCRAQAD